MAKQILTTCKGIAMYPHLRKPEMYEGQEIGYTIKLVPSKEDADELEAFLRGELEKVSALPEFAGKSFANANIGAGETKDGDTVFKFKTKSSGTTKSGETFQRIVPIYDSTGKPLPKSVDVGSGSTVKVAYSIHPYYKNKNMKGITLYLEAVQVIELVPPGERKADYFGFGTEEGGYVATEDDVRDNPFDGGEDVTGEADF